MNQITLPQVWVVDDDADIRELLSTYLSQNGFQVSVADGGAALRQMLSQASPDVLVLDLMMPGEDGLSLTRFIKSHWDIPILMLSARGEEMDRIIGLEVGADDYLPKPFGPRELLARLRALLRRHPPAPHATERPSAGPSITPVTQPALDILTFGPFRLNTAARTLKRDEQDIELTTAEFELLEALVRRPLRVLSRDMLISLLKGYERDAFDRSIDNRVTRLRRKIESGPASPHYIRTVRGEGYLFNPEGEQA
ncbi:response regulator [Malikia granosa]|uniref:Two-component system response regulator OmpR n=1 Tax=Malikia granosa TaxID=263067 RepID=A0A2S9K5X5_9BURK|nr:response regulator [Malikia granosa]PRD65838.1 two-component system response regulator OmpR [Malikia granosa]